MSGHKFKIGQAVIFLGREKASGTYKVMQLMPSEGGDFNIASETLTSRTTALSKKAISIASHEQDKH